ncbi:chemotaxis protein CheD [Actibacterium sp. 188UL27-1]|uniref:chemotaxis protein CheD n=1 Tax=Actibacterium sp. 188UL27-1 TaxID=2786961 RepID=UPI00195B1DCF|nr:chemotaxis protein CheD [Actibacterium sp. 188UL27-1]MBM7066743.1 chemotaxis protein CheD [Actibacterium sp. 188UL27-1]
MPTDLSPLKRTHRIVQGEYAASGDVDIVFATLLGSCVSACLWDPLAKVGGLNHIVLPNATDNTVRAAYHGVHAMELLINEIIKLGGQKQRLKGKLFGGARMVAGLSDVGERNARFAVDFLNGEGIECLSHSLGGFSARKIRFVPTTGKARQMLVSADQVNDAISLSPPMNDIEIF